MTDLKVSTIANIKKAATATRILKLEGWDEETPFVCKVRRSSLRIAIISGKIPNALMGAAQALYEGSASKARGTIQEKIRVMHLIIEDALIEPKYSELEEAGITLTENQASAIFNYAQRGIKAATPFLFQPANPDDGEDGVPVEDEAEPAAGD